MRSRREKSTSMLCSLLFIITIIIKNISITSIIIVVISNSSSSSSSSICCLSGGIDKPRGISGFFVHRGSRSPSSAQLPPASPVWELWRKTKVVLVKEVS